MGGEAQIREDENGRPVVVRELRCAPLSRVLDLPQSPAEPPGRERANGPVLRREQRSVDELERPLQTSAGGRHDIGLAASDFAVEMREIEVDAEDERQHAERRKREPRPTRDRSQRREQDEVEGGVGLGVEVPPEQGDAPGKTREPPVGVVEQRLQLQQQRCDDERRRGEEGAGDETGGAGCEDDGRRGDPQREQDEGESVSKWSVERRDDELARRPILVGGRDGTKRGGVGGSRHGERSIVDTGAMAEPDGWSEVDNALERTFELASFKHALDFVNRVGELAEREDHHPGIAIDYKQVTLRWWTHTADGITDRDRELAEKTNALA